MELAVLRHSMLKRVLREATYLRRPLHLQLLIPASLQELVVLAELLVLLNQPPSQTREHYSLKVDRCLLLSPLAVSRQAWVG